MKLNNQQITALAEKFKYELIDNKELLEKKEIEKYYKSKKTLFDSCIKILEKNTFLNKVTVNLENGYVANIDKDSKHDSWINSYNMVNNLIGLKMIIPTMETLKRDIVLATIDSQSIEDIMKILKLKYK